MRVTTALLSFLLLTLNAYAVVEPGRIHFQNGISYFASHPGIAPPPPGAATYVSTVYFGTDPANAPYHGDLFYSQAGANLVRYNYTVDVYSDWFRLDYGAEFSPRTHPAGIRLGVSEFAIPLEISPHPFYLAVHLSSPQLPSQDLCFGWAQMINDANGLRLVDSGFSKDGVYIGTFDVVPEPSAASLLSLSFAAAALLKWPHRKVATPPVISGR